MGNYFPFLVIQMFAQQHFQIIVEIYTSVARSILILENWFGLTFWQIA